MSKREEFNRRRPHPVGDNWFYVDVDYCSFHIANVTGGGFQITTSRLLRALDAAGILRLWDRKQKVSR